MRNAVGTAMATLARSELTTDQQIGDRVDRLEAERTADQTTSKDARQDVLDNRSQRKTTRKKVVGWNAKRKTIDAARATLEKALEGAAGAGALPGPTSVAVAAEVAAARAVLRVAAGHGFKSIARAISWAVAKITHLAGRMAKGRTKIDALDKAVPGLRDALDAAREATQHVSDELADPSLQPYGFSRNGQPTRSKQHTEAVVFTEGGHFLREQGAQQSSIVTKVKNGTRVFITSVDEYDWAHVVTDKGVTGYISIKVLKTDLPCPGARLHKVKPGQTALRLAHHYFKDEETYGRDGRFYVNVLQYVNQAHSKGDQHDWEHVGFDAGSYIWIPTASFANSLKGRVDNGSITDGLWGRTKAAVAKIGDILIGGPAFCLGFLQGVAEQVADTLKSFVDLVPQLIGLLKSLFTDNLLGSLEALWAGVKALGSEQVLGPLKDKWTSGDVWTRWRNRGEIVGNLATLVVLTFAGGSVGKLIAGAAAKVARAFEVVKNLPAVRRLGALLDRGKSAFTDLRRRLERGDDGAVEPPKREPGAPARKPPEEPPLTDATRANLHQQLEQHGLAGNPMFKGLGELSAQKVERALRTGMPKASAEARAAALEFAQVEAKGDPRAFANLYELANTRYGALRSATRTSLTKGTPKAVVDAEASDRFAQSAAKLHSILIQDSAAVKALRSGGKLEAGITTSAGPEEIGVQVKTLDRVEMESPEAESYHARKHGDELGEEGREGQLGSRGEPDLGKLVQSYDRSAQRTIKHGRIASAERIDGDKVKLEITRELPNRRTAKAIIYVGPDGSVTLATYGAR